MIRKWLESRGWACVAEDGEDAPYSKLHHSRYRTAAEALYFEAGILDTEMRGLRRRVHLLECHNQHFERCESGWCHPGPDAQPALAMGAPDVWPVPGVSLPVNSMIEQQAARIAVLEAALAEAAKDNREHAKRLLGVARRCAEIAEERFSGDCARRIASDIRREFGVEGGKK